MRNERRRAASIARTWGTTDAERDSWWACDGVLAGTDSYYRGVDVAAPPGWIFRWLCQLRVAPYSYDLVDNLGRRSPRQLTPGLDELEAGQVFMTMFRLHSFEVPRHVTLRTAPGRAERFFGRIAVTYRVDPGDAACRLLAKLNVDYPGGWRGALLRRTLPWGDLVMMRRQLLRLTSLAERSALP